MDTLTKTRTERYATGMYFVYYENVRIGVIVGAKQSWLAEQGPAYSEYHVSKARAVDAIRERYIAGLS